MTNRSFAENVIVVFVLAIITGFAGYALRITLARNLSIEEFGLFYGVLTVFMFIGYFVEAGIGTSLSRKIIELRLSKKFSSINNIIVSTLLMQLLFTIIIAVILILLRNTLSINYFHGDVSNIIVLLSMWLLFIPLISSLTSIFYGFKKVTSFALVDSIKAIMLVILCILLLLLGYSKISAAIAYVISTLIMVVILFFWSRKIFPLSLKFSFRLADSMSVLGFGFYILLSNLIWTFITQIDTFVVIYFTNSTSVAMYQIAIATASILLFFTNAIVMVLFPTISEAFLAKNIKDLAKTINLIYKYVSIILVPSVIAIVLFPNIIITLLFTSKYLLAIDTLRILTIAIVFSSLTLINNSILTALNKPKVVITNMIVIAVLNLVLNLLLVPKYGIMGAAISTLISFMLSAIVSNISVQKSIKFTYPLRTWKVLFFSVLLLLGIFYVLRTVLVLNPYLEAGIIFSVLLAIYGGILLITKEVTIVDINSLILRKK